MDFKFLEKNFPPRTFNFLFWLDSDSILILYKMLRLEQNPLFVAISNDCDNFSGDVNRDLRAYLLCIF